MEQGDRGDGPGHEERPSVPEEQDEARVELVVGLGERARARASRRASLLAARDARMRVAMVAVVSVAVYTCAEIPDVNQGSVVPIAVSHARSAMPANRIPKNTVRTKGHRRAPTASRAGPASRGRMLRRSSSPDHAIECPQDHAQGHPRDGPWDRVEAGRSLIRWNGDRVYGAIPRFAARGVDGRDRVVVRLASLGRRVAVLG